MSAHFTLQDLDAETPTRTLAEPSKPRVMNLRSKSSKKRKGTEMIDLTDLTAEARKVTEALCQSHDEKAQMLADLQKKYDARVAVHEKDATALNALRKEFRILKDTLDKQALDCEARVRKAVDEAKRDALIVVMEARIKMAGEAEAQGCDTSVWDLDTWKLKLAKAKTEAANQDPKGSGSKIPKAPKASVKTPRSSPERALEEKALETGEEDAEMTEQDLVPKELGDLAEAAAGDKAEKDNKLGDDGQ